MVGGDFGGAGGVLTGEVARYNPIANTWSGLGPGFTAGPVNAIAVLANGERGESIARTWDEKARQDLTTVTRLGASGR